MSASEILATPLFKKCLEFHGHLCPGLSYGYQAATAGMAWLAEQRSEDEEIVAIVETDACCSDAVQVITGCTFGKGNFIYHDYGKMAFTFVSRNSGKGVRVARRFEDGTASDPRHAELMDKMKQGSASPAEKAEFTRRHEARSLEILNLPPEKLFHITEVTLPMPPRARMEPSVACDGCNEPTMGSKMEKIRDQTLCRGCAARLAAS